jgi:hypothetical protein
MSKPMQVYAVYYREHGAEWTTPPPGIIQFRAAQSRAKWLAKSDHVAEVKILTFTHTNTRVVE